MHTPEKPSFIPGPYAVQLCQEPGIFNQSYFVTALRPNGFSNEEIVICRLPTGAGEYSEQLANARLLAAAPALFEALRAIQQKTWFNDGDPVELRLAALGEIWNLAQAELAKVRGHS